MTEFSFGFRPPLHVGRVVFDVQNVGSQPHQMVLEALPPDVPPIDQQLHGPVRYGAPSLGVVARDPGQSRTLAFDLAAGRYALVCFLRGPDGVPHSLKGMDAEFRVR